MSEDAFLGKSVEKWTLCGLHACRPFPHFSLLWRVWSVIVWRGWEILILKGRNLPLHGKPLALGWRANPSSCGLDSWRVYHGLTCLRKFSVWKEVIQSYLGRPSSLFGHSPRAARGHPQVWWVGTANFQLFSKRSKKLLKRWRTSDWAGMLEENHFEFSFLIFWFPAVYLPVIKHGMLENLPAIVRCFSPSKTDIHWVRGFSIAIFDCRNMLSQIIPLYPQVTDDFQWFPIVQQPCLITPQRGVSGKSMKIHHRPRGSSPWMLWCYGGCSRIFWMFLGKDW